MHLRVDTRHGPLEAAIELPAGEQLTLAGLAAAVLPLAGAAEALAARHGTERSRPPACRKGCGACCRQLVTVSPAEAWMIADLIEARPEPAHEATPGTADVPVRSSIVALPAPRREETRRRFAQAGAALARAGLLGRLERLDDPALDDAAHYGLARDYFNLALACPFQDPISGACDIHSRRPAVCREYLVSSLADRCAAPFERPPARLPLAAEVSQALLGLCAQVLGRELEPIPLVLAPRWAAAHAPAAARRWDAGRLIERFLLNLEVAIGQLAQEEEEKNEE